MAAASARLCVETYCRFLRGMMMAQQPPPCGCVLKQELGIYFRLGLLAAASARLCVETIVSAIHLSAITLAAASARLCVETLTLNIKLSMRTSSRLRAAVC